jgi:hypothetical protein
MRHVISELLGTAVYAVKCIIIVNNSEINMIIRKTIKISLLSIKDS